jgi:hypothetical protein
VVTSPALTLHLRATEFVTALRLQLGADVFFSAGPCPACQAPSDKLADHNHCCTFEGEHIAHHNALHATAAALAPFKERRFLLLDSGRKLADNFLPYWSAGRDTAWDITVTDPLQDAMLARAATTPGHASFKAYSRKMREVGELCRREGMVFIPLAMESLGGWHKGALKEVKKLGGALARHTRQEGETISRLFGKLAVLLVKGNKALVNNQAPGNTLPSIDGQL